MEWLSTLDLNMLLWIHETFRHDALTPVMKCITALGNAGIFWIVVTLFLLFRKKTRPEGLAAAASLLLTFIICNLILKNMVGRIRPYDAHEAVKLLIPPESDLSFPSGHTSSSFAAAFIYLKTLPKKYGIPAMLLATAIAISRLYLGAHYVTDVVAGFLIAWICSCIVYYFYVKTKKRPL